MIPEERLIQITEGKRADDSEQVEIANELLSARSTLAEWGRMIADLMDERADLRNEVWELRNDLD